MNYHIRNAVREDMEQVLNLITELAIFEKEPNAVEITAADLQAKGFGSSPEFHCFVAESDQKIIGIALVYTRFSTWKGTVLHLEDLIVSEHVRGHGIGSALLDQVILYGDNQGVKRVCWEVIDWNTPAIEFYEHKGARVMRDWDVVQLDEQGMKNYISKLK
ncbi:MAG: GNAT family N-acetyltransferase [Flavobacteriaceae bacterium]|jgi:GNAT superfamily N-acetyltransferase|nr:GNAT family N-acetyltransferase [Flavobacteriaceae bacterium]